MIVFSGTKKVGEQRLMVFTNEVGARVEIPLDDKVVQMMTLHFDRLSPGAKRVENLDAEDSEGI